MMDEGYFAHYDNNRLLKYAAYQSKLDVVKVIKTQIKPIECSKFNDVNPMLLVKNTFKPMNFIDCGITSVHSCTIDKLIKQDNAAMSERVLLLSDNDKIADEYYYDTFKYQI